RYRRRRRTTRWASRRRRRPLVSAALPVRPRCRPATPARRVAHERASASESWAQSLGASCDRGAKRSGRMSVADVLLLGLGAVAVGAAFRVVRTQHLVRAGLWLVVTLGAVAGAYLVLAAELVAWVPVLLYVGAVVVLLLFAVMLTRAPIGASDDLDRPRWAGVLVGGAAGLGLATLLASAYRWSRVPIARPGTAARI